MRFVRDSKIAAMLPGDLTAITIGQTCYVKRGARLSDETVAEEQAHAQQWKKYGWIFPVLYLWELMRHGYKNNKYEIEAKLKARGIINRRNP